MRDQRRMAKEDVTYLDSFTTPTSTGLSLFFLFALELGPDLFVVFPALLELLLTFLIQARAVLSHFFVTVGVSNI